MPPMKISLLILYSLLIAYVSLANDSSADATVPDLNSYGISYLDKLAHAGAYALLGIMAVMAFGTNRSISVCIILIIYGLILETLQHWVPLREPSLADFMANVVGVLLGVLFMRWLSVPPQKNQTTIIPPTTKNGEAEK